MCEEGPEISERVQKYITLPLSAAPEWVQLPIKGFGKGLERFSQVQRVQ